MGELPATIVFGNLLAEENLVKRLKQNGFERRVVLGEIVKFQLYSCKVQRFDGAPKGSQ